jgi:hypothetical protein
MSTNRKDKNVWGIPSIATYLTSIMMSFLTYITGFFMNFELLLILTDYAN